MKIVFMGTPDFAVSALARLAEKHEIVCVYTQAPKEAGRGHQLRKSPVHQFAEEHGLLVRTPRSLRQEEEQEAFQALNADVAIVAAYGLILPKPILEAFPYGCINIHASLLPRWRGAAPIQRAIEAGDKESGITVMKMDEGLDTGDMLMKAAVEITSETTGGLLHDALAETGAELIVKTLDNLDDIRPEKQGGDKTCYAAKINKDESLIDFSLAAEVLERKIRAFNPYPGMYFEYEGERFKILRARVCAECGAAGEILEGKERLLIACGKGALEVMEIQRQGKKSMPTEDLLRGFSFLTKTCL